MMTGTAEKMAEAPKTEIKFVEDMTAAELAKLAPVFTCVVDVQSYMVLCLFL